MNVFKNKNLKCGSVLKRGFTLFELLVAISIFVLITTVVVFNHSKFNSDILITDIAYQVALSIREAQVYGTSARGVGGNYSVGYGVYFNAIEPKSYILFADTSNIGDNNKKYDSGDQKIKTYKITRGDGVFNLCVYYSKGLSKCFKPTGQKPSEGSILFLRPDPDAHFNSNFAPPGQTPIERMTITVSSASGNIKKKVVVEATGQISIENDI